MMHRILRLLRGIAWLAGWLRDFAYRLLTMAGVLLVAWLWFLCLKYQGELDRRKNADPLGDYHAGFGGHAGVADAGLDWERTLPSGEKIRLNNYDALFVGDREADDPRSDRLFPSFASAIDFARAEKLPLLPSIAIIQHKLKREDDALIETAQREVQRELLPLLRSLATDLATSTTAGAREAAAWVAAALILAGSPPENPALALDRRARELIAAFESGALPEGRGRDFNDAEVARRYQREPELARIFKCQRFLMERLDPAAADAFVRVLQRDAPQRLRLEKIENVSAVWNNAAETSTVLCGLRRPAAALGNLHLLPYAQSPENRYYFQRYGFGAMPASAVWIDEIVQGLRRGSMAFKPRPGSGWYDYKFYALTPLVRADQSYPLRVGKLLATPAYRGFMEETFRAALAGLRETHVLSVGPPPKGLGGDGDGPFDLAPEFSCEPEPAVYWRLAQAYQFIAGRLAPESESARKAAALGGVARDLAALSLMELGLPVKGLDGWTPAAGRNLQDEALQARAWLAALPADPVFKEDPRLVVDAADKRKWGIAGVRLHRLRYDYDKPPTVLSPGREVRRQKAVYYAPVPVAVEFSRPIPEAQFAGLCAKFTKVGDCLAALGATDPLHPERSLSLPLALTILTILVLAHAVWWNRAISRRRRGAVRLPWKRRILRQAAWLAALAAFWLYGRLFIVLFVVPRIDLPPRERAEWCAGLAGALFYYQDRYYEGFARYRLIMPSFIVDGISPRRLINVALHSDTRVVREIALNSFNFVEGGSVSPIHFEALYALCRDRGYGEASQAFIYLLTSSPCYDMAHASEHEKQVSRACFAKVRGIYHQYGDPEMLINSAYLIRNAGDANDWAELESVVKDTSRSPERRKMFSGLFTAVNELLQLRTEVLPYDRLVELGFFPANPADGTSATLGTWPRGYDPVIYNLLSYQHSLEYRLNGNPPLSPEIKARLQQARQDLRPIQLILHCLGNQPAQLTDLVRMLSFEHLPEPQQDYYDHWLGEYLAPSGELLKDDQLVSMVVQTLRNRGTDSDPHNRNESFYALLHRLLASPWKDLPNPEYDPKWGGPLAHLKTCGELFQALIADRERLDKQNAQPPIDPVTGMPNGALQPGLMTSIP